MITINTVLNYVNNITVVCDGKPLIVLPYIQQCNLGDDYATIVSVTGHEMLVKGLVATIISNCKSQDIPSCKRVNNYERNHGEYVLYKIVTEWDTDSACKSTYYFIK